jgi:hypothetical protein
LQAQGEQDVLDWLAPLGQQPPASLHEGFLAVSLAYAACNRTRQPFETASYPLFLAEIAAFTHELLLQDHVLKNACSTWANR